MCPLCVCSCAVSVGSLRSLSVRLREGEVNGWKVKGVSVSSRSRAEGSLSGVGSSLGGLSGPNRSSIGLVYGLQCIWSVSTGISGS